MKNLVVRTLSGAVMVWAVLEATASGNAWYYILWGGIFLLILTEFWGLATSDKLKGKGLWLLFGTAYIALGGAVVYLLNEDWIYLVALLTIVWANDVGAYLVGISIGRHKMAPKISPKKSWEGFFGGLVWAVGVALCWQHFYFSKIPTIGIDSAPILYWAATGLVCGLAAVGGDLLESYFKRQVGVKDSGKIIPGHGGMLDRFDALLLALPVFYLMLKLLIIK